MLVKKQLIEMLNLQSKMNETVNAEWLKAGYPFLRAAAMEAAEAIDHMTWKWWKKQEPNVPQAQMEMIDIWHFYLSDMLILNDGNAEAAANRILYEASTKNYFNDCYSIDLTENDVVRHLEYLMSDCAGVLRSVSMPLFSRIIEQLGLSWDELFTVYIGKNVLNIFRQENGYKQGTYRKNWHDGREDNEHLTEILHSLPADIANYASVLSNCLAIRYSQEAANA